MSRSASRSSPPRGWPAVRRLRLSGSGVASDQRRRIRAGAAGAFARYGYAHTAVARIIEPAGVSRRTFYELFTSKENAFLSAHEEGLAALTERVSAATSGSPSWPHGVGAAVSAALAFAATFPERGLLLTGGPQTAGPWAGQAHDQLLARFAPALRRGRELCAAPRPPMLEEYLLGAIAALVANRLRAGRRRELNALAPQLTEFALVPYLGLNKQA
jgi:AcrR family transcriptional regulator